MLAEDEAGARCKLARYFTQGLGEAWQQAVVTATAEDAVSYFQS